MRLSTAVALSAAFLTGCSGEERDDWTLLSDHAAFFRAGIPHLYFGVEDHPDYHKPTDTFDSITPAFFVDAVRTIIQSITVLDQDLATFTVEPAQR